MGRQTFHQRRMIMHNCRKDRAGTSMSRLRRSTGHPLVLAIAKSRVVQRVFVVSALRMTK